MMAGRCPKCVDHDCDTTRLCPYCFNTRDRAVYEESMRALHGERGRLRSVELSRRWGDGAFWAAMGALVTVPWGAETAVDIAVALFVVGKLVSLYFLRRAARVDA